MEITAMQELINELKLIESYPMNPLVLRIATDLLEKEKEQMIDFYTWMRRNDSAEEYFHYSDEDMLEEYYNQTYNDATK
jgi:hypothetical protein